MSEFLVRNPNGFHYGFTPITTIGEIEHDTGIHFGILKLKSGEEKTITSDLESAYLLIHGKCILRHDDISTEADRQSCFDEDPIAIHFAAHKTIHIHALTDCEFAVSEVKNAQSFETKIFDKTNILESEQRGKDLLHDTAHRIVRTIFDIRNRPESKLVLGEVINAPGRWSSYPPHHHAQPEIYHYRFTEPQGYGHAECGDDVFKVKQFDTYKILNEKDHAQTAAPGYGMYYIWVIRHLDNKPYGTPQFAEEHNWARTENANHRVWKGTFHHEVKK